MDVKGGWFADEVRQKGGWEQVIRSLDLTEKQKDGAVAILDYFARRGLEYRTLTAHENSSKSWPGRFLTKRAAREMAGDLEKRGICSYRYAWYLLAWLVRNGWLDAPGKKNGRGPVTQINGRTVKGYAFSDRVLRCAHAMVSRIPKLWEVEQAKTRTIPVSRTKRRGS